MKILITAFLTLVNSLALANMKELQFNSTKFLYRTSSAYETYDFTPDKQTDPEKYHEIITLNVYPQVKDTKALSQIANEVAESYAEHGAPFIDKIQKTKTPLKEYFFSTQWPIEKTAEASFTRFFLNDGIGMSAIYTQRFYGLKAKTEMNTWVKKNGKKIKSELLSWKKIPNILTLKEITESEPIQIKTLTQYIKDTHHGNQT